MLDGFWMNYEMKRIKWAIITEHETWIRDWKNAKKMGVPEDVFAHFQQYIPHTDRIPMLKWLMETTPLMRIRGHGTYITFEFSNTDVTRAVKGIAKWGEECAGIFSLLKIHNFASGKDYNVRWKDFNPDKACAALS
ncbi:MAG: hypothetical protein WCP12_02060 [bacterium]